MMSPPATASLMYPYLYTMPPAGNPAATNNQLASLAGMPNNLAATGALPPTPQTSMPNIMDPNLSSLTSMGSLQNLNNINNLLLVSFFNINFFSSKNQH